MGNYRDKILLMDEVEIVGPKVIRLKGQIYEKFRYEIVFEADLILFLLHETGLEEERLYTLMRFKTLPRVYYSADLQSCWIKEDLKVYAHEVREYFGLNHEASDVCH